uniref:Uncharacterized protein n=1 Tax=Kalanchoe fedtschenkoi TaxID=63787 RepID=A0A7N0VNG7_KALFE
MHQTQQRQKQEKALTCAVGSHMVYPASQISMESARAGEIQLQLTDESRGVNCESSSRASVSGRRRKLRLPKLVHYKWWLRIAAYTVFILVGQSAAVLLGRLYFDKGGGSKWMATFIQSAGFPAIVPLVCFFRCRRAAELDRRGNDGRQPSAAVFAGLYIFFGVLLAGDNLMYSYGLVYLPVSTYSLLCATQLAFNAVFAYFMNRQKFTSLQYYPLQKKFVLEFKLIPEVSKR